VDLDDDVVGRLRARRLELVDDRGRTRAVLGEMDGLGGPDAIGLTLLDADGRPRAWFHLEASGPLLGFDRAGNDALTLGVVDGPDASVPGPFVAVSDEAGVPTLVVRVEADGSLVVRTRGGPD
jgi:hypothetical protein